MIDFGLRSRAFLGLATVLVGAGGLRCSSDEGATNGGASDGGTEAADVGVPDVAITTDSSAGSGGSNEDGGADVGQGGAGTDGGSADSSGGAAGDASPDGAGHDASIDANPDTSADVVSDVPATNDANDVTSNDAGDAPEAASCQDGTVEQSFDGGAVGCGGQVEWVDRASLCGVGAHVCTASRWASLRAGAAVPMHDFWIEDPLVIDTATADGGVACSANPTGFDNPNDDKYECFDSTGTFEGGSVPAPMRVCAPNHIDPLGNECNWVQCGIDDPPDSGVVNEYFGGCSGNPTAGTLCCNAGTAQCADGTAEQTFVAGMVGCAGQVLWDDRDSLCGGISTACTATQWTAQRGSTVPTHHYWTNDNLRWNTPEEACWVSTSSGNLCTASSPDNVVYPMRLCSSSQPDAEGNTCGTRGCGLGSDAANDYLGGCNAADTTAGSLCCPD